jgi:hypothetical protein
MRLKLTCAGLVAAAVAGLGIAGAAGALPAPKTQFIGATSVTRSSAILDATVFPNGNTTNFHFVYGPTTTLVGGSAVESTAIRSVRYDVTSRAVSVKLKGLQPGTTYYYKVALQSAAGIGSSPVLSFTTAGTAPTRPITGGAQVLSPTSVKLTGVVNSSAGATAYAFELGTTTQYTSTTIPVTVRRSGHPTQVSVTVKGLTPFTTYHYRLTTTRAGVSDAPGADATLETFPRPVPEPTLIQHTKPESDQRAPYDFVTVGRVKNPTFTPTTLACTGEATISFYYRSRRVLRELAPLTPGCTFSATAIFARLPVPGPGSEQLSVYVRFLGNHYLRAVRLKPETITVG